MQAAWIEMAIVCGCLISFPKHKFYLTFSDNFRLKFKFKFSKYNGKVQKPEI